MFFRKTPASVQGLWEALPLQEQPLRAQVSPPEVPPVYVPLLRKDLSPQGQSQKAPPNPREHGGGFGEVVEGALFALLRTPPQKRAAHAVAFFGRGFGIGSN